MPLVPFPAVAPGELTIERTCSQLTPPSVLLGWDPTNYGSGFLAYGVWRRPARAIVVPFTKIGRITVPPGENPATIEAQHNAFIDDEAGWHRDERGHYSDGWDYAFSAENTKGLESLFSMILEGEVVPAAQNAWETCNAARWLNSPLQVVPAAESTSDIHPIIREYAGRDLAMMRTPANLPYRSLSASGLFLANVGPDQLRSLRATEASGRRVSLLRQNGDLIRGGLTVPKWKDADGGAQFQEVGLTMTETSREAELADYNLPASIPLNGSSQYVTTPHDPRLGNGDGPFSAVIAARFPTASGAVHLSKGHFEGYPQSWGIGNISGTVMALKVQGVTHLTLQTPTDGEVHVVGISVAESSQQLYLDGALVGSLDSVGIDQTTNASDLVAGANNEGASGFSALGYQSHGYWPRALTSHEHEATAHYLLSHPGFRPRAGAGALYDLRDDRCLARLAGSFLGLPLADLSGGGLYAYVRGTPPCRGYPWPLRDLEAF